MACLVGISSKTASGRERNTTDCPIVQIQHEMGSVEMANRAVKADLKCCS